MEFNSKETYLQARQQWKCDYAELSEKIRHAKSQFARWSKCHYHYITSSYWKQNPDLVVEAKEACKEFLYWGSVRATNKQKARNMLEDLASAKVEAARQYSESKRSSV